MITPYNYNDREKNKILIGTPSAGGSKIVPFNYNKKTEQVDVIQKLVEESTSPYKLSGKTQLTQSKGDEVPDNFRGDIQSLGFPGRAALAAFDSTNETFNTTVKSFGDLFSTLSASNLRDDALRVLTDPKTGEVDYSKPTGLTIGMTPEERKAYYDDLQRQGTPLSKGLAAGKAGLSTVPFIFPEFIQLGAELAAAKELPGDIKNPLTYPTGIIKFGAYVADEVIQKLGSLGSYSVGKGIDKLALEPEVKEQVKPFAEEVGAFMAQLVVMKAGMKVAEKGLGGTNYNVKVESEFVKDGKRYVTTKDHGTMTQEAYRELTEQKGLYSKLPFNEKTKGQLSKGTQTAVGLSMAPFSTGFSLASAKFTQKLYERRLKNIKIDAEEMKRVVEETKKELLGDVEKLKVEHVDETTKKLTEFETKLEESRQQTADLLQERKLIDTPAKDMKPEDIDAVRTRLEKFKPESDKDVLIKKSALQEIEAYNEAGILLNEGKNINHFTKRLDEISRENKLITSPENLQRLPAPSGDVEGKGFTMTDKADPAKMNKQKLLNDFRKAQEAYNKKATPANLAKLRKAKVNYSNSFEKPVVTPAEKVSPETAPAPAAKVRVVKEEAPVKEDVVRTAKETKELEENQSRVYERLKEEHPEILKDDASYDAIKLKEDAKEAVELVARDKEEAYRIAMSQNAKRGGPTATAINIALAEVALKEGNYELYNQLVKTRSFEQTRRGQEIAAEKGSVSDNSTGKYVKELINAQMEKLGKSRLGNMLETVKLKKGSNIKRAEEIIKKKTDQVEKQVKSKEMDLKEAQKFLDDLACA